MLSTFRENEQPIVLCSIIFLPHTAFLFCNNFAIERESDANSCKITWSYDNEDESEPPKTRTTIDYLYFERDLTGQITGCFEQYHKYPDGTKDTEIPLLENLTFILTNSTE